MGFAANAAGRVLASGDPDVWSVLPVLDCVAAVAAVAAVVLWARIVREVSAGQRRATTTGSTGWA